MGRIAIAWRWMLAKVGKYRMQLRLCLRVTIAAMAAFILAQFVAIPLGGLWAVLTAIVVTQMSLGGSLRATIEYFVGTFGGAVYAGAIAALVPHQTEISTLAVLALAVAPLALLAAINPNFRVGPFTAVIVVLGATATHTDPISSAFYRVLEVALGGFIGLLVSFLVLPARAHVLVIAAAARMLNLLADALPVLFAGFTQVVDVEEVRRLQIDLGAAFARIDGVGADAKREQATYLMADLDSRPLLRTMLRLRHDVVIVARAATVPLPEQFRVPGSDHRLRISLQQLRLICAPAQRRLSGGAGLLHWTRSMQRSVHLALGSTTREGIGLCGICQATPWSVFLRSASRSSNCARISSILRAARRNSHSWA